MKKQIIAIGGGAMSKMSDTFPIEKYILEQANMENPKVCFMATATGDAERNIVRFYDVFANFKCERTHLSLISPPKDIESFIMNQDIIYVGGGNTRNLLVLWREWNLDKILYRAYQNGTILTGFSAGSICWFEEGLSDYIPSELNSLKGLGYLKGSHCPHYDSEVKRKTRYRELISNKIMSAGIAADDDVALHYIDAELKHVVSANPNGAGYSLVNTSNGLQEIRLNPDIFLGVA